MNQPLNLIDHRDINQQLDLYHINPNSPGMVLWHPNGCYIFERLQQWLRLQLMQAGYWEVRSPIQLPIRYFDFSPLSRNEPSGALHGILHLRAFHQFDVRYHGEQQE
ncbi:MAG: aminoacyl--tRNA ligase-related protein [Pseudomonadota bacterium]